MDKLIQKKKFLLLSVLFAGYLIFNGIMLAGHELWRDEANVWLLARDNSPFELLSQIKYQGHPCLWYFLVMPFAKLGFPFFTLSILSFIVMAVTAGLFVYRMPLHPVTKAVCLFSPIFSYYYSVVARNYCLIALLLMLLAYWYPRRNAKPFLYGLFLGLLVQADTIALAAAGLISAMWLWEGIAVSIRRKEKMPLVTALKGLWIPLVSLGLWILQFAGVAESSEFRLSTYSLEQWGQEIRNYSYYILIRMTGQEQGFAALIILFVTAAGIGIMIKTKSFWPFAVMAGSFLFHVIFSLLVYQLHIWHYISLCFVLLWMLWTGTLMETEEGRKETKAGGFITKQGAEKWEKWLHSGKRILSEGTLILLGITMFLRWNAPQEASSLENALNGLYSDGVHVAEYIEENIGKDAVILSTDVTEAATVQAYLGKEYLFYYAGTLQPATYANYNEDQKISITYEELIRKLQKTFPAAKEAYLLICPSNCVGEISREHREQWELCYETKEETARGEEYSLYKIRW